MAWVDANGISLHYAVDGESDRTVVLMHEMGGSLDSWDGVVTGLVAAGHRVLRYDQRGSGLSEKPRGPITARLLTDDLVGVIDAVGGSGPLHLVAVAASSVQALMFADQRTADVASLTLCNPATGVDPARAAQLEERAALAERDGIRATLAATLDRSYPAELGDRAEYERYRGRYLANDPVCFANLNRALVGADVSALWTRLTCPTMIVAGRFDQVRPPAATQAFASQLPAARFEFVDSGHMMPAQAPTQLGELLVDFLATASAATAAGVPGGPACA